MSEKDLRKKINLPQETKVKAEIVNNLICPYCDYQAKTSLQFKGHILGEQIDKYRRCGKCEYLPSLCSSLNIEQREININKRLQIWEALGDGREEKNSRGTFISKGNYCIYCTACDKKFTRYTKDTLDHPEKCKALKTGWKSIETQQYEDKLNKLRRLKIKEKTKLFTKGIKLTNRVRGFNWRHLRESYWFVWNCECNIEFMPSNCTYINCENPSIKDAFPKNYKLNSDIKKLYEANCQDSTYEMLKQMKLEFTKLLELIDCEKPNTKALKLAYVWCPFFELRGNIDKLGYNFSSGGGIFNIDWAFEFDNETEKELFGFYKRKIYYKSSLINTSLVKIVKNIYENSPFKYKSKRHVWAIIGLKYIIKQLFGDPAVHISYWKTETDKKYKQEYGGYINDIYNIEELSASN